MDLNIQIYYLKSLATAWVLLQKTALPPPYEKNRSRGGIERSVSCLPHRAAASASWLNSYTMISYVPVWKLSARRYREYHFPRWYVSSSGTSRRLEIIEVRRGIAHPIDYARCHWLRPREEAFVPEDEAPKARSMKPVWWNIINGKEKNRGKKVKGGGGGGMDSRRGMTRCEFALWRRSYRRISTSDYLAGRLRFQIGIRIANAPIGKVLWTYCRRGMVERDARGPA